MYAIVKTGGKQYRVEEGQSLLVERLPGEDGAKIPLEPLLYVDGSNVVDGDGLSRVKVEARVVSQERGPKLRIVKFKPKRGYKRRTGHRQELTRIEVTSVKLGSGRSSAKTTEPKAVAAPGTKPKAPAAEVKAPAAEAKAPAAEAKAPAEKSARKPAARKPAARKPPAAKAEKADAPAKKDAPARKPAARKPRTTKPKTEDGNGS